MKPALTLAFFAVPALWAADAVSLDIKPGQWEYTVTVQMNGMSHGAPTQMPLIPPEQLAKLPPEQRAKVEAALKQAGNMASGRPVTHTNKSCVKKEDLLNFNPTDLPKSCKLTVTNSTRSKFEGKAVCDTADNKTTSTIVAESLNSESMKFTVASNGTADGQPVNMTINGTGKWLSAACTDSK